MTTGTDIFQYSEQVCSALSYVNNLTINITLHLSSTFLSLTCSARFGLNRTFTLAPVCCLVSLHTDKKSDIYWWHLGIQQLLNSKLGPTVSKATHSATIPQVYGAYENYKSFTAV